MTALATIKPMLLKPNTPSQLGRFEIDAYGVGSELRHTMRNADEWIFVHTAALPHTDERIHFGGDRFFLTLSCVDGWRFGDAKFCAKHFTDGKPVPAGTLFAVDLDQPHWLSPNFPTPADPVWVGMQWRCRDRRKLFAKVRELVDAFGGVLLPNADSRYRWLTR
jgi:hypothetical protein